MEKTPVPSRKISRRGLLKGVVAVTGALAIDAALNQVSSLIPGALAQEAPKQPLKEPGLLEGEEREFKLRQLNNFIGEFVTPKTLDMFIDGGLLPENLFQVKTRSLPDGASTSFYVDIEGSGHTYGRLINRAGGVLKEATVFYDRGDMTMDEFAEEVKTWLKNKEVQFIDDVLDDTEDSEIETEVQLLTTRQASDEPEIIPEIRRLHADFPPPPVAYRHPDTNEYYISSENFITLYPDGQVVFHQEHESSNLSLDNKPI